MYKPVHHNGAVAYFAPRSLDLNFLTEKLDPRIAFSRPSAGMRWNSAGLLEPVASGQPAFDFDPVTLAIRGWLMQEQRTNLFLWSNDFTNAAWTKTRLSSTTKDQPSVDGSNGACLLTSDGSGSSYCYQSASFTAGQTYTLSAIAKAGTGSSIVLTSFTQPGSCRFTLTGQGSTSSLTGIAGNPVITPLGNGRYWCSITLTASSTGANNVSPGLIEAANQSAVLEYAQLEAGSFRTHPILTTTAQVTRAADVATMPVGSWFNPVEGALVAEYSPLVSASPANQFLLQLSTDSGNYIALFRDNTNGRDVARIRSGAVDGMFSYPAASAVSAGAVGKIALGYRVNDSFAAVNGGAPLAAAPPAVPAVDGCGIGGSPYTSSVPFNGWLRRISAYRARPTLANIRSLSA